jgi:hypothetical protein
MCVTHHHEEEEEALRMCQLLKTKCLHLKKNSFLLFIDNILDEIDSHELYSFGDG